MKQLATLFSLLLTVCSVFAQRTGEMEIQGTMCKYDTLIHRTIAPGAMLTQYQFTRIPVDNTYYKMKVHVITIDATNPYNSLSPYLAKGQYYKANTQIQEVERQKGLGLKPIATITGGGFAQSNNVTATNKAYEASGSLVGNGKTFYENSSSKLNCYWGSDKLAHIGYVQLAASASGNGSTMQIGQVNHYRDKADSKQILSLFCNGIQSSVASEATKTSGTDLIVKINDGTIVKSGVETNCTVKEVVSGCNNIIGTGEAILSGVGKAEEFLKTFKAGDQITITLDYVNSNNEKIDVQNQLTHLFNYCIKDGEVYPAPFLDTKGSYNYAIDVIGCSQDGKTTYLADLEISTSSTAPCICLADLLKDIGVYNAIWLDGGPSAEMSVDGSFITTNSIGYGFNGRYIPAGIMLYSTAPDDNTLASIELTDPSPRTIATHSSFTLEMYGYNQYGEMIKENAQTSNDVEITCTEGIGTISKGVFTAGNAGTGYIYIKVKGSDKVTTIPVEVVSNRKLTVYPKNLFTGEERKCQLQLLYTEDGHTQSLDPALATWTKVGRYVVVDCSNGIITPGINGTANIYVTYNGLCDTATVTVENLQEAVSKLDLTDKVQESLTSKYQLPSVPKSIELELKGEPQTQVTLYYTLGDEDTYSQTETLSEEGKASMKVAFNYDAVDTYPVILEGLTGSSKDVLCTITQLTAYYDDVDGIKQVEALDENLKSNVIYTITGQRTNAPLHGINIIGGKKIIVK